MRPLLHAAIAAALLAPLAGCFSYHEVPAPQPQPPVVVTTPPPSSGSVVVTPQP